MASVVGKTIFSDVKGKLYFGYYKDDDGAFLVDYKTWKNLGFKDVSKGDTNKERVIKAILKNQKQFNKKVEFNMWAKQKKRTFEETMDWFIQNGWINNINRGGIKESIDVLSVNEATPKIKNTISKKEWRKTPKFNKHIGQDGTHYLMKYDDKIGTYLQAVNVVDESVSEALKADPRKVYGGTGAKEGMVLVRQDGFKKILDLSKKNPSNVFIVSDDNYTNFGPFYVKNGNVAKYTVANPNYDLEKNKVRSVKVPNDVILKFKVVE